MPVLLGALAQPEKCAKCLKNIDEKHATRPAPPPHRPPKSSPRRLALGAQP